MTKGAVIELWESYARIGRLMATMAGASAAALLSQIKWLIGYDAYLIKLLVTFSLGCFLLTLFLEMILLGNIYAYISKLKFNELPEGRLKKIYSSVQLGPPIDRPKEVRSIARNRGVLSPALIVLGWGASLLMLWIIIWKPEYA